MVFLGQLLTQIRYDFHMSCSPAPQKIHNALEDKTRAEACGITVVGSNKWLTLIQNAGDASEKVK